jgi:hypothetical protein
MRMFSHQPDEQAQQPQHLIVEATTRAGYARSRISQEDVPELFELAEKVPARITIWGVDAYAREQPCSHRVCAGHQDAQLCAHQLVCAHPGPVGIHGDLATGLRVDRLSDSENVVRSV